MSDNYFLLLLYPQYAHLKYLSNLLNRQKFNHKEDKWKSQKWRKSWKIILKIR